MADPTRIEEVFFAALEVDPAARDAYLDSVCGADPDLRREVQSLLAADENARRFLEPPPPALDAPDPNVGRLLGPWRLVEKVGSGGMGSVYLAERSDAAFEKKVAVKLIRAGLETEELLRRFRHERQVLAALEHPDIARLVDGGADEDGSPYLVMEYVEGVPIDRFCDERALSVAERLKLFRRVCGAVQHAHRNLVVHRDLKPSNILVTSEGEVKLLDFGISKVLAETEADGAVTAAGTQALTPRYASPEQIRGEPTTTATDVYSLGVVLYELLTGCRPYQTDSLPRRDVERVITETAPLRPSAAAASGPSAIAAREGGPRRLARRIAGDLDNVVLRALRKEPERRYGSVEQLSDDIRRHLEGFPVVARPDTAWYRAAKFARRNLAAVTAAALVVALLVTFSAVMWVQLGRTRTERDRANREAEVARQTAEFLESLFRVSNPDEARGRTVTAREILERGAQKIETDLTDQPLVQARLLRTIGGVHTNLGLYEDARPLLERSVEIHRATPGTDPLEVAASLDALANLHRRTGNTEESLARAEEALALRERAFGPEHVGIAASLNNVAILRTRMGDVDGARALLARAVAIREKATGPDDPDLAVPLYSLANLEFARGDFAAARPLYERALRIWESTLGEDDPKVAAALESLAQIASEEGRYDEAESLQLRSLAVMTKVYGPEHDATGGALSNLALIRKNAGDAAAAREPAERAVAVLEKALGTDHASVAAAHLTLAEVLLETGEPARAETSFRRAIAILEAQVPPGDPTREKALREYASALRATGRAGDAAAVEARLREAAPAAVPSR